MTNTDKPNLADISEKEIDRAVAGLDQSRHEALTRGVREDVRKVGNHMRAASESAMHFTPKKSLADLTDSDKAEMQFIIKSQLERDLYQNIVKNALELSGVTVSAADAAAIQDDLIQDPTIFYTLTTPHLNAVLDDGTRSPIQIADIATEALSLVYTEILPNPAVAEFFGVN